MTSAASKGSVSLADVAPARQRRAGSGIISLDHNSSIKEALEVRGAALAARHATGHPQSTTSTPEIRLSLHDGPAHSAPAGAYVSPAPRTWAGVCWRSKYRHNHTGSLV